MQIGSWFIQGYTLRVLSGLLPGVIWVWGVGRRQGYTSRQLAILLWATLFGGVLGGRLGYVAQNAAYFAQNPGAFILLWRVGGLDGSGAWLGGLAAAMAYAWHTRTPARQVLELLAPLALLLSAGAWWGCGYTGCAWGREVSGAAASWQRWLIRELPDLYYTLAPRYAIQLLAAGWALGLAGILALWRGHALTIFALYLAGLSMLTLLRADPVLSIGNLRLDTVVYGVLALGGGLLEIAGSQKIRR